MVRAASKAFLAACIFLCTAAAAFSQPMYISVSGGVDNGTVDTYKLGREDNYHSSFKPIFNVRMDGEFADYYNYRLSVSSDPFWQNTVNAALGFKMGVVIASMGVQIGMHDPESGINLLDIEFWNIGLDGDIKLEFPGIFYLGTTFILDLGGGNWTANKPGSAHRQQFGVYGGFWLPHILISGGYSNRNYDAIVTDTTSVRAGHTRLFGRIEFFAKKIPFRIAAEGGLVTQTSNFSVATLWEEPKTSEQIFAGGGFSIDFSRFFRLFLNVDITLSGAQTDVPVTGSLGVSIRAMGNGP
ncbi:MAG: hypothetical protein LBC77_02575 [Spirochaetaceae bacterium]|jgi:hypothetical protein|nr:hypothetical protein [Spirochaetaceae bacterium]